MGQTNNDFERVLQAALGKRDLSALAAMLREAAVMCGAIGAVLWKARIEAATCGSEDLDSHSRSATDSDLSKLPPEQTSLYALAYGFLDERVICVLRNLPLESAAGQALRHEYYESDDCSQDALVDRDNDFYRSVHPGSIFGVRVRFEDGTLGVLTVYRLQTGGFDDEAKDALRRIAYNDLTTFYSVILDRANYRLVEATSARFDNAVDESPEETLNKITREVSDLLNCKEVSIFLEDKRTKPGVYSLRASSCPEIICHESFLVEEDGLSAFAVRNQKPIIILDMMFPPQCMGAKIEFYDAPMTTARLRTSFDVSPDEVFPPTSFIAAPIVVGNSTVGVIRCQFRPLSPHFFSERDIDLLKIVGARIGSFWNRYLRETENRITTDLWETFVDELNKLEMHLRDVSAKAKRARVARTFQEEIFGQGLAALHRSIIGADILDVALVDADRQTIAPMVMRPEDARQHFFQVHAGSMKLPLNPEGDNSWSFIFHNYQREKIFFIHDTSKAKIPYKAIFPEVKQALFAPIIADNQCIGILSIRSKSFFRDIEKAKRMASLVALQVGLYHQLTTLLSRQARTYQDLAHQLRTPVFQARKRLRWMVEKSRDAGYELLAVNGLLAKTQRVLSNMQLYEDLAFDRPVTARREENPMDALVKLLIEACSDNRVLWSKHKINFNVDRESFQKTRVTDVRYDSSLLEQVINNLLDNAGKYSLQSSEVSISARLENKQLEITIKNRALVRIERDEIPMLGERGFRSTKAKRFTAEGSGIGLFLTKQIMLAHKGTLDVKETDLAGFNRITIGLPV